ncbi:hypothetical protein [uncultured Psychroserpens sp.]|uniref:hypothetical protein n=1 Tax=uncultured Psychroserpens sp. TaxID=255436 RepID=UPI0026237D15|nr:hypothetical protein [uncultured Psychroserpens sp.]
MTTTIKISSFILLILTIFSCHNAEQKPIKTIKKDYGLFKNENDSLGVELKLNEFNNWKDLLKRTETIVCNDSLPKLTLKSDKGLKTVYFRNPCWEDFGCILIKQKNTIQIHNDTINKSDQFFYPLDSLANVLRRDFENNGKIPSLSANSEKLLIFISYDNGKIETFPKTLRKVINTYEKITDSIVLKIWLNEKIDVAPPPPPPEDWQAEIESLH